MLSPSHDRMRLLDMCHAINARVERQRIGLLRGLVSYIVLETMWELATRPWPVVEKTLRDTRTFRTIRLPRRIGDSARRLYWLGPQDEKPNGIPPWREGHTAALMRIRNGVQARLAALAPGDPAQASLQRELEAVELAIQMLVP